MIFQRCSARSCIASFLIYLFAAVMVFYGDLPYLPWWADGMGITVMLTPSDALRRNGQGAEVGAADAVQRPALPDF